jgi:hypothetical protein
MKPTTVAARSKAMNCFRSLKHWDRRFKSHSRHGCLCLCCPVYRLRLCDELISHPRRPTVCQKNYYGTEEEARVPVQLNRLLHSDYIY